MRWPAALRAGPLRRPTCVLLVLVAGYIALSFWLSQLRLEEGFTSNWDLGIFQQMMFSTLHGHPFYEAGDWESTNLTSYLALHPALVVAAFVLFYALAPSASTLFAIQSVLAASAAIPLYGIALRVTGRPWASAGFGGMYLASAALLSANLFDFHLELMLPLETALLFYCWITQRRAATVAVTVLACFTLEVMPFFVAAMALIFLVPPLGSLRATLRASRAARGVGRRLAYLASAARRWFRSPEVRFALGIFVLAAGLYAAGRLLQWYVVPALVPPPPNPAAIPLPPAPTGGLAFFYTGSFGVSIFAKLRFWLIEVALLGLLPLFAPRQLLLVLPWFVFTLQSPLIVWTTFGIQYVAIPVAALTIAAIYGYARIRAVWVQAAAPTDPPWARGTRRRALSTRLRQARGYLGARPRLLGVLTALFAIAVLALNVSLSPANPLEQRTQSGQPGYNVQWVSTRPGYQYALDLAALIPAGGVVLATSDLFPLVANDVNAYALLWYNNPSQPLQLPFAPGIRSPDYLLLSFVQSGVLPPWLEAEIFHRVYGLRAVASPVPTQIDYLYELDYRGPTTFIGPG
jgi:uncharacterized membrane protein